MCTGKLFLCFSEFGSLLNTLSDFQCGNIPGNNFSKDVPVRSTVALLWMY
jgi:hypothetical protein